MNEQGTDEPYPIFGVSTMNFGMCNLQAGYVIDWVGAELLSSASSASRNTLRM
jgi:hypothetical protein